MMLRTCVLNANTCSEMLTCADIMGRVEMLAQSSAASQSFQARSNAGFDWAVGIAGVKLVNQFSRPQWADLQSDTAGDDTAVIDDDDDIGGAELEKVLRVIIRLQAWQRGVIARRRILGRVPQVASLHATPPALEG